MNPIAQTTTDRAVYPIFLSLSLAFRCHPLFCLLRADSRGEHKQRIRRRRRTRAGEIALAGADSCPVKQSKRPSSFVKTADELSSVVRGSRVARKKARRMNKTNEAARRSGREIPSVSADLTCFRVRVARINSLSVVTFPSFDRLPKLRRLTEGC